MPKAALGNLALDVLMEQCALLEVEQLKIFTGALEALQHTAEALVTDYFRDANLCAQRAQGHNHATRQCAPSQPGTIRGAVKTEISSKLSIRFSSPAVRAGRAEISGYHTILYYAIAFCTIRALRRVGSSWSFYLLGFKARDLVWRV